MQTQQGQSDTVLPRAIQRQVKRVNDRIEARASASASNSPPPANGEAAAVTDLEHQPGQAAAPTPTPAPTSNDRENDPGYWRARFQVTQGMLRKAQDDLREAQAEADRQIQELRNQMAELQAAAPASPGKVDITAFFTPEQIERFGEDQCEAMAQAAIKAARTQADELVKAAVEPIQKQAKQQQRDAQQAAEATFWERLAELTPDYAEVNAMPEWLVWLAERDPRTKQVRQDILDNHRKTLNADGVSAVFEAFKSEQNPGKTTNEPPTSVPRSGGDSGGGDRGGDIKGKGYPTRDEIRNFHKRAATIKNPRDPRFVTDKERKEFEARLQLPKPA